MAKLTLTHAKRPNERSSGSSDFAHRAEPTEGDAARRLLEDNGYPVKNKRNGQYEMRCPFHEGPGEVPRNKSANFYLDADTSRYYCHSATCGERGNLITLEQFFGISSSDLPEFETRETRLKKYEANLTPDRRDVFYEHGLNDATIERFRLGWDPDQGCYVIPYLEGRRPVLFRFYDPTCTVGPGGSKYWWEAGSTARLFNPNDAVGDDKHRVFIAEGEQKAMLLWQLGYAAVAVPGAGMFKDEWFKAFNDAHEVYVCFDNDSPEDHKYENCRRCDTDVCRGHNPGQEAATKLVEQFGWRAQNILLPLPEGAPKTDINEFFVRDGGTAADFAELALGESKTPYVVQTFAEIAAEPPEETTFLVDEGILPQAGRLLMAGKPKSGKAESVDTLLPMADGSRKRMGDIEVGDRLIGRDGRATTVTHVHPQGRVSLYRVTFGDGSSTICSGDHLWNVANKNYERRDEWMTLDTLALKETLESAAGSARYYIPMVRPVEFEREVTYEIHPYIVGALIGDGGLTHHPGFTTGDSEVKDFFDALKPEWMTTNWFKRSAWQTWLGGDLVRFHLERLGLLGCGSRDKFIPDEYLVGSIEDRMELLRGLMDTDGGMNGNSACFYTTSERLRDGVKDLVGSLGGVVSESYKSATESYTLTIRLPEELGPPFSLGRKVGRWAERRKRRPMRRIVEVMQVQDGEAQCVTVDAEDSLYCSDGFVVTHNSILAENLALSLSAGIPFLGRFKVDHPTRVLLLDRELSRRSLYDRLMALTEYRPGYRAAWENLCVDHDHMLKIDQPNAYDVLHKLVCHNGAEVLIMDTAYKFFSGDMESSSRMSKAFDVLDRLIHETGVAVVMTHHIRKSGSKDAGKAEVADPDNVAGSFLWTGWPNATVLLSFLNRSVEDPFNTVCNFTAFRDHAPPEPLALYRSRDSIGYSAISDYSHEESGESTHRDGPAVKPTERAVADLLLELCPITEDDFMFAACNHFGVRRHTIRPYFVAAMASEFFEKTNGRPPVIKYIEPVQEETWEQERQLKLVGED